MLFIPLKKQALCLFFAALGLAFASQSKADLYIESFGFNGAGWGFSYVDQVSKFNRRPIALGYTLVSFVNKSSNVRVDYFVVNDGAHYTVCQPDLESVLPTLRNMVMAQESNDPEMVVLYEAQVHSDLLLTCDRSFRSELEFKRQFNTAVAFSSVPGLQH